MERTLHELIVGYGEPLLFMIGIFSIGILWFQLRCIWVESQEENLNAVQMNKGTVGHGPGAMTVPGRC